MGEILVDLEIIDAAHAGVVQTLRGLQATLDDLETGLRPMVSTWSGSAQQAYLVCKRQWDDAATALATILADIGVAVATAHTNYGAAHQATVRVWS